MLAHALRACPSCQLRQGSPILGPCLCVVVGVPACAFSQNRRACHLSSTPLPALHHQHPPTTIARPPFGTQVALDSRPGTLSVDGRYLSVHFHRHSLITSWVYWLSLNRPSTRNPQTRKPQPPGYYIHTHLYAPSSPASDSAWLGPRQTLSDTFRADRRLSALVIPSPHLVPRARLFRLDPAVLVFVAPRHRSRPTT